MASWYSVRSSLSLPAKKYARRGWSEVDADGDLDVGHRRPQRAVVVVAVAEVDHVVLRRSGQRRLEPAVEQRHHVGLRGVVADEELLPEAIEPFELHAQRHAGLDAVVGADRVVLGLDVPAGADVAVPLGVFGGRDPAAVAVALPFLVAAQVRLRQPAELLAPDEARPQFLHLVERVPLVVELLIAEQPPGRLVIGIGLDRRQGQLEGQPRAAAPHGASSHLVERRGLIAPQPAEPRVPFHHVRRGVCPIS